MDFALYSDVVLLRDCPDENVYAGNIGTVVDRHDIQGLEIGYSVEFFDMLGNGVGVVTFPAHDFRLPTRQDRPTVRAIAQVA